MQRPSAPVAQLPFNELRELQQLLVRAGYNVGKVDGIMGQQSRSAVKAMQIKYGLPADSWPTAELLARMRGQPAAPRAQPAVARTIGGSLRRDRFKSCISPAEAPLQAAQPCISTKFHSTKRA